MRFFEILSEASIFSRGTYNYGHQVKIATRSEQGKKLLSAIQEKIPDFGENEVLVWAKTPTANSIKVKVGKDINNERYFVRSDNSSIILQGTDKSIESGLNHAGSAIKFNKGDIAEGVLGAAITAKLIKRGKDRIGNITPDDVKSILSMAVSKKENTLVYEVNDKNSNIADKIKFSIKLTGPSSEIINDTTQWSKFESLFNSTAHYANSVDSERYSDYFYKNGKVDEVYVTSDGVSGQKNRKTDVSVVVKDPITGTIRNLKNVDISLKADSKQFGQIGTGGLKGGYDKWMVSAKKLFEPFGINLSDTTDRETKTDIVAFFREMYSQAGDKLNEALAGSNVKKETTFVEKIADVIFHQATLKVPNVRIVNLEKGQSTIHSFAYLKQKMISNNVDLTTTVIIGRTGYPTISIFDKNSGKVLAKIRYFSTKLGDKSAHVFEKGPLLHELTMTNKTKSKEKESDQIQNPDNNVVPPTSNKVDPLPGNKLDIE